MDRSLQSHELKLNKRESAFLESVLLTCPVACVAQQLWPEGGRSRSLSLLISILIDGAIGLELHYYLMEQYCRAVTLENQTKCDGQGLGCGGKRDPQGKFSWPSPFASIKRQVYVIIVGTEP